MNRMYWNKKVEGSFIWIFLLLFLPTFAWADQLYLNTMSILDTVITIIFALCHIVGIVFIFLSLVYYRRFRQNPHETPLSRVFWVLILGTIIFLLPTLAKLNGIYDTMQTASEEVLVTE